MPRFCTKFNGFAAALGLSTVVGCGVSLWPAGSAAQTLDDGLRGAMSDAGTAQAPNGEAPGGISTPAYEPGTPAASSPAPGDDGTSPFDEDEDEDEASEESAEGESPDDAQAGRDARATGALPSEAGPARNPYRALEPARPTNERAEPGNTRMEAIEGGRETGPDDPYAPLGLRVGTFTLTPTLEQGLAWTSNADASAAGEEAVLSETTLRLNAVSDWSRHGATLDAYGTFRKSLSGQDVSDLEGGARAALRLDLAAGYSATAGLGYSVRPESASSPVTIIGVDERPLRHTLESELGLAKDVGKLRVSLRGALTRDQFGDATLTDGTHLSQEERNATLATLRLRTGYRLSPALTPFIEGEIGRRFYDRKRDAAGYERSATRFAGRAGIAVDLREKLSGELSLGWIGENLDDERLDDISALALAASLEWSPRRGTTVGLDGETTVEGTTNAGESGSVLHSATLRVERRIRANLTAEALASASWRHYVDGNDDRDLTLAGQLGMTWWLNRYLGLTGRVRYEEMTSTLPGRDYDATTVFMGLRMQR